MARSGKSNSGNKTVATNASVAKFLDAVEPARRREDAQVLLSLFEQETGESPVLWGTSIVGFGEYHYRYESGREGDSMKTGFSPRKSSLVLYIMPGFDALSELQSALGKYRTGKSCLYINKLADVDLPTLRKIVKQGYDEMSRRYDCNNS